MILYVIVVSSFEADIQFSFLKNNGQGLSTYKQIYSQNIWQNPNINIWVKKQVNSLFVDLFAYSTVTDKKNKSVCYKK